ncbi:MAG: hypothetical protein JWQ98_2888 [Chlorobi bacterium]|nr:hypothetical protein [Chlorobiota bacterium]
MKGRNWCPGGFINEYFPIPDYVPVEGEENFPDYAVKSAIPYRLWLARRGSGLPVSVQPVVFRRPSCPGIPLLPGRPVTVPMI